MLLALMLFPLSAYAADGPFTVPSVATVNRHHIQHPRMPNKEAVARAAHESHEKLSHFKPSRIPVQSFPKMLKQPSGHVNFNEVIKNAGKIKQAITRPKHVSPNLMVFVSFSMPRENLKRLAAQAGLAGIPVMLRGLVADAHGKPSFHATGIAVGKLNLGNNQGFSVSPMAFKRFSVTQVPTFVLLMEKDCITCGAGFVPKYLKISGDVSLDYALRVMKTRRPRSSARIKPYLKRLKSGFFNKPLPARK